MLRILIQTQGLAVIIVVVSGAAMPPLDVAHAQHARNPDRGRFAFAALWIEGSMTAPRRLKGAFSS